MKEKKDQIEFYLTEIKDRLDDMNVLQNQVRELTNSIKQELSDEANDF